MKLRRILALSLLLLSTLTPASLAETAHPGFYQPQENAAMDYDDSESRWSFARSVESEHFLLFWEAGFCENPLNAAPDMRVDTADLLEKAELFYAENVDRLHMADEPLPGGDKLQIYLLYTADWVATGAGYDNPHRRVVDFARDVSARRVSDCARNRALLSVSDILSGAGKRCAG